MTDGPIGTRGPGGPNTGSSQPQPIPRVKIDRTSQSVISPDILDEEGIRWLYDPVSKPCR